MYFQSTLTIHITISFFILIIQLQSLVIADTRCDGRKTWCSTISRCLSSSTGCPQVSQSIHTSILINLKIVLFVFDWLFLGEYSHSLFLNSFSHRQSIVVEVHVGVQLRALVSRTQLDVRDLIQTSLSSFSSLYVSPLIVSSLSLGRVNHTHKQEREQILTSAEVWFAQTGPWTIESMVWWSKDPEFQSIL